MRRLTVGLAFMLACGTLSAAEHWFALNGNTLQHGKQQIRLLGIEAPQLSETCLDAAGTRWRCGRDARDHVRRLIATGDVSCTIEGKDRYGRDLSVCFVGGIDLGRDLVQHGLAVVYRAAPRYLEEEREARIAKRGMWARQNAGPDD
jgi:endonuclease YncB( thermonuclease family)